MPTRTPPQAPGSQHGAALIWIIMLITLFVGMGGYMVKNYSASRMAAVNANLSTRAELLAESGYRFLSAEYFGAADDETRNQVLDELHGQDFETGTSTGTFSLSVTSYFYRLTADPGGSTSLTAAFVGDAGAPVPSTGYLSLGADHTAYEYTAAAYNAGTGAYTFTMVDTMPSLDAWTTVRPVIQTTIASTISEGDDLTLGSGQGDIFPGINGVFWIGTDGYRYEYRSGDTLHNVTAPHGRTFTAIASGSTLIELNKFLTVESQGTIGGLAAASTVYEVPLDSSDEAAGEEPETYIADAMDFVPDADGLGTWEEVEEDGSLAIKSTGERLIDTMNVGEVIHVLVEAARTIRDSVSNIFVRLGWSIIVALLRAAADVLDALGILDNTIDLPDEIGRYKAFAFYDWWTAGFDMIEYWQGHSHTLSYDVQTKFSINPDQTHYMAGLFLRNDNDTENGGDTLGVSILRGDSTWTDLTGNGDGIPDALVPVNRSGADTPLIVVWAQKDLNDDDIITPSWTFTSIDGTVVQLWPEEREWLAWAALPTNYCLLESGNTAWFDDWITLMVRIHEHVLTADSGSFSAGDQVNDIRVYLTTIADCGGGGSAGTGTPSLFQMDHRRYGQDRYEYGNTEIHWPLFDADNFTASYDYFSLLGGTALQIDWDGVRASPTPTLGINLDLAGTAADKEYNAVIRTDAFTTENYSDTAYPSQNRFPEEVGLHVYGAGEGVVFVDDFAIRFMGNDPNTGGGTGFFPPVLN